MLCPTCKKVELTRFGKDKAVCYNCGQRVQFVPESIS